MQEQLRKFAWSILAALAALFLVAGAAVAHEGRPVGEYRFIVGWLEEPAYEGANNAVSVAITRIVDVGEAETMGMTQEEHDQSGHQESEDSDDKDGDATPKAGMAGQHEGMAVPVEGLGGSLQVEVIHVASGTSRIFDLEAKYGDPGHYVAGLIPTASGVYEFRIFGGIEGMEVDETFVSVGGGGGFDDIRPSADIQFPEQLPELREVVGAVQGARDIAQQAQDTALEAQAGAGGGNVLAIVALIVGIVGALLGAGGIYLAVKSP